MPEAGQAASDAALQNAEGPVYRPAKVHRLHLGSHGAWKQIRGRQEDMAFLADLRQRARQLTVEIAALGIAARHPLTPWPAKLLVVAIVAYAVSPIDLIPDFLPVIGHLDDLILIPLGIALAIRMIPGSVWAECRERAQAKQARSTVA
jgi:uncharacterized membrane protein YkvA (DUF1232 family)